MQLNNLKTYLPQVRTAYDLPANYCISLLIFHYTIAIDFMGIDTRKQQEV
jgi:hypothetical protein